MKNIHVLPTDKPSRLRIGDNGNFVFGLTQNSITSKNDSYTNQHIYITSDEEIKEEDWIYGLFNGGVILRSKYNIPKHTQDYLEFGLKIILTTDQDLIADGVQPIDDEFLEWFVKNPSCEFVPIITTIVQDEAEYKTNIGFESWRKEEPKQETLEEFANNYSKDPFVITGVLIGAKWQAERMYSEEDMFEFSQWISHEDWVYLRSRGYWVNEEQEELEQKLSSKEILNLWFEQFKKKQ